MAFKLNCDADGFISFDESEDLHLGRISLRVFKEHENEINHVDIATDEVETHGSVRLNSIRVAEALRRRGLKVGDVIVLCAVNHIQICLPIHASNLIGTCVQTLHTEMHRNEIHQRFSVKLPKVIICDSVIAKTFADVSKEFNHDVEIIVFGELPEDGNFTPFNDLLKPTGTEDTFKATDFNPLTTVSLILCSSGSTGMPKGVCLTHSAMASNMIYAELVYYDIKNTHSEKIYMNFSSLYWVSGFFGLMNSSLHGYTNIHCSEPFSMDYFIKGLEKYKPTKMVMSPVSLHEIVKYPKIRGVNFSSLKLAFCGGSSISAEVINRFQNLLPNGNVVTLYGSTEAVNICTGMKYKNNSVGTMNPWVKWKIVNPETEEQITVPGKIGELRIKVDSLFKEYYHNPAQTAEAFDSEKWYKTGDLFYYDSEGYFFLVDRLKEIIKYKGYQVAPVELEKEITNVPGVFIAAVVGVPHPEYGDLPMAFVELCKGAKVSAQQIKNAVKDSLSDSKQLRGGVVFLDKMPTTVSGKVDKKLLHTMKLTASVE